MKITNLIDNRRGASASRSLAIEHGFSLFIECAGLKLLFDAGASGLLVENSYALGIKLAEVDKIICSHGHYDHTLGLKAVLRSDAGPELLFGEDFFRYKFKLEDGEYRYNGMPFSKQEMLDYLAEMVYVGKERELAPGLYLLSQVENRRESNFFHKDGDTFVPDYFLDECFLVYDQGDGLVVVTGCAHPGIINMLDRVKERFPGKKVKLLAGGLHLFRSDDEEVLATGRALLDYGVERIAVSHCAGERILELMNDERFFHFGVGDSIEI